MDKKSRSEERDFLGLMGGIEPLTILILFKQKIINSITDFGHSKAVFFFIYKYSKNIISFLIINNRFPGTSEICLKNVNAK